MITPNIPRIFDWWLIGWSSADSSKRCVGNVYAAGGWKKFVEMNVLPTLSWGVEGILVHNPFGCLPNEDMMFDQYLYAKNAKLDWLIKDFVSAWRPVTSQVEVVGYLGRIQGEPKFEALKQPTKVDDWLKRFYKSIAFVLDAGMSVAFDGAAGYATDTPEALIIQFLNAMGVKCYVEARPRKFTPFLSYPVIAIDQTWHQQDPELSQNPWMQQNMAKNSELTGEILRLINTPPTGHTWADYDTWIMDYAQSILNDGHSVTASVTKLMKAGIKKSDFVYLKKGV